MARTVAALVSARCITVQGVGVQASTVVSWRATTIEPWEDGARTDNSAGTYEWWYFDAHLDDGANLIVVFMNKDLSEPGKSLSPLLRLELELPDGRHLQKMVHYSPDEWAAATDHADVRIGDNRFSGDLHTYHITAADDEVSVDITLTADVPSWRPGTGHILFGTDGQQDFGWLPAVPQGTVTGSYTVDGTTHPARGVGYHDHNWGNVGLMQVVHHWYWARGQAGPYTVIASHITAAAKYGYEPIIIFMLARDNTVLLDDPDKVTFETDGIYTDISTKKPVASITRYIYRDGEDRYSVTFTRSRDLTRSKMADSLTGFKRIAAKATRFDGAYLRFIGNLEISPHRGEELIDSYRDQAIWELMYFGHPRPE
ncbi:lipocalin-like domain-containing protein [Nocardia cyriacigeorgica]|uniref:lipocalin-like domain-containing protein n=1 Tax=Nocardia cyriacigeorgica TaxID=135487 RepID=UPI002455B282|nr:lipocalin-like domain-containing protein [Nocardia cyriacigeorgica]